MEPDVVDELGGHPNLDVYRNTTRSSSWINAHVGPIVKLAP